MRKIKVDTTPRDLTVCFSKCTEEGTKSFALTASEMLSEAEVVRFSSTIGSNIMITKSGVKVRLIVAKGFEDMHGATVTIEMAGSQLGGTPIKFIVEDTPTQPAQTLDKARKLVEIDKARVRDVGQVTCRAHD